MARALPPRDQVEQGFDYLANNHPESIHDLFVYFDDYWIDNVPIDLWNVSQLKVRTHNNAEGKTLSSIVFTILEICLFRKAQ